MKNNKQLIILFGTDEAIKSFNKHMLPKVNEDIKNTFTSLYIDYDSVSDDLNNLEELDDIQNSFSKEEKTVDTIRFILESEDTQYIDNIFLFLETEDINLVETSVALILNETKPLFSDVKFVFLTVQPEESIGVNSDYYKKIISISKEYGLNTNLEDLFSDVNIKYEKLDIIREIGTLYNLIDLTHMAYQDELENIPKEISDQIEFGLLKMFKKFNS